MAFGSKSLQKNLEKPKGGGVQKKLRPGNHKAKVYGIKTSTQNWKGVDKLFLHLLIEGEALENFEGFMISKDNPKLGRHAGQIGDVKTSGFGYDDSRKDKDGETITKEESCVMFLDALCHEANGSTWVKDAIINSRFESFEDFIDAFNKENPIKDVFLHFCIGGTQDTNDEGYPVYFLQLPKYEKGFRLFANDEHKDTLLPYNQSEHLYVKSAPQQVNNFKGSDDDDQPAISSGDDIDFEVSSNAEMPFEMDDEVIDTFSVEED